MAQAVRYFLHVAILLTISASKELATYVIGDVARRLEALRQMPRIENILPDEAGCACGDDHDQLGAVVTAVDTT